MRHVVYTILEADVGTILRIEDDDLGLGRELEVGRIQAQDVGKQVFDVGGILQVENAEQLKRRLG